jgi:hypothetical protein
VVASLTPGKRAGAPIAVLSPATRPAATAGSSTPSGSGWSTAARAGLAIAVLLAIALRFLQLDADPHYYEWIGYITDEGRWTDQARDLAVFGRAPGPGKLLHTLVAPLFQLTTAGVFGAFGVSVWSSRVLSAAAGSLVVVMFCAALRRVTPPEALLLGALPLAVQVDLVTLSRLAVPEIPVLALELLLYLTVVAGTPSAARGVAGAVLGVLTAGMKLTAAPVVGILGLGLVPRRSASPPGARRAARWAGLVAFAATLGALAVGVVAVGLACCRTAVPAVVSTAELLPAMLGSATVYDVVSFPFDDALAAELNVIALGCWLALLAARAAWKDDAGPRARRLLATSAAWSALYLGLMLSASYFPNRYKVHIAVPMCMTLAVGLGLLLRVGIARVETAWGAAAGVSRWPRLACLASPTAVFLAPLVGSALGAAGLDAFRLRARLIAVLLSMAIVTVVLERVVRVSRRPTFVLLFPFVAALAWLVGQRSGWVAAGFWPVASAPRPPAAWLLLLLLSVAASAALVMRRGDRRPSLRAGLVLGGAAYAGLALLQLAPGYLAPHRSIPETSRQLGALLAGVPGVVGSSGADGLFRENRLRYRTIWGRRWPADRPDIMVIVFAFDDPDEVLGREYCALRTYPLYIAPAYYRAHPFERPASALGEAARVYAKRITPRCPEAPPR